MISFDQIRELSCGNIGHRRVEQQTIENLENLLEESLLSVSRNSWILVIPGLAFRAMLRKPQCDDFGGMCVHPCPHLFEIVSRDTIALHTMQGTPGTSSI